MKKVKKWLLLLAENSKKIRPKRKLETIRMMQQKSKQIFRPRLRKQNVENEKNGRNINGKRKKKKQNKRQNRKLNKKILNKNKK